MPRSAGVKTENDVIIPVVAERVGQNIKKQGYIQG